MKSGLPSPLKSPVTTKTEIADASPVKLRGGEISLAVTECDRDTSASSAPSGHHQIRIAVAVEIRRGQRKRSLEP